MEPRLVLFSDSSSSRQLIARKGLGKARHLDVDLLWIQRIPKLIIKAIKGKDNPSDLGTKSLTRDKIKKYMVTLGYVGEYLDQEAQEVQEGEVRRASSRSKMSFDEKTVTRIIQAVTTAVLIGLAEGRKEAEEGLGSAASVWMKCMLCMSLLICVAAAIFQIKPLKGGSQEEKRKEEGEKKRRSVVEMATEDEVKMMITEKARSIETQNFLASQLRKEEKDRLSKDDMLKEVARLNEFRESKPTPPEKPESEAGTDPSSDEDEKEEKKHEEKEEKKKESSSDGESSSSDEKEKKEDFKKTAEELQQEAVMKGRLDDLAEMKEDAESRRAKVAEAANKVAEKAEETNEEAAAGKTEETDEEAAAGKAKETEEEAAAWKGQRDR